MTSKEALEVLLNGNQFPKDFNNKLKAIIERDLFILDTLKESVFIYDCEDRYFVNMRTLEVNEETEKNVNRWLKDD